MLRSQIMFVLAAACAAAAQEDATPHAGMLRYPDVSATHAVFSFANDLWLVPREGGMAEPLASPPGPEVLARFSPDGKTIAFVGNYAGNRDLYTLPVEGGIPVRVTHHPAGEILWDWSPDSKLIYSTNGFAGLGRQLQLFTVDATGGMPEKMPVPYGSNGTISPDGTWLAYTPHSRDTRTWKRYRGGMASDIWLFNLQDHTSVRVTDWEGTDTFPMWHGQMLYYMSDAGSNHRLNIWSYDIPSGQRRQVTDFADYDVKWPAMGPGPDGGGEIVFQNGSSLYLLDLNTDRSRKLEVTIPGARPKLRPASVDEGDFIQGWAIGSTGKRAVMQARGDVWTLPAEHGSPRNLTRTSGVAERDPSWSPDARWIAYFSDETGEYELYIRPSDAGGEPKQLTHDSHLFYSTPTWSPDSRHIAFTDNSGAMRLLTVETGQMKQFDEDPMAGQPRLAWSPDSRWITYAKNTDSVLSTIWIYDVENDKTTQVTGGMFRDTSPTFDREGKYLYFASNREFSDPSYDDLGLNWVYDKSDRLYLVPLRDDVDSPWLAKSDEETWKDEGDKAEDEAKDDDAKDNDDKSKADDEKDQDEADKDDAKKDQAESDDAKNDDEEGEDEDKDEKEVEPVEIDLEGFEHRAIPVPVDRGTFYVLAVTHDNKLLYVRAGDEPSLKIFDPADEKKEEKTVMNGADGFDLSADAKKLMIAKDGKYAIIDAAPDQKMDKPMSTEGMTTVIDPRAEWAQIFRDAWRIQREFFYDPNMHGLDWEGVRRQYEPMLADCASREDVSFVIGEMISELNVGHAYYFGGDVEGEPHMNVGMLGCDFKLATDDAGNTAYQITDIIEGGPWDVDARGPLSEPGVDVSEGDFLLAVNGLALDTSKDPWAAFVGLTDQAVTITVSSKATLDEDARKVVVKPTADESLLRFRAWIEHNRAYVADQTDNQVGYIYVPNTGVDGQNELVRQFFGQRDKAALIIDERWNGGGQIPTRFIELLNRPVTNFWAVRHGKDWIWPPDAHQGPKCMLINGMAGSGGDMFPALFRQAGLGKIIGMRTWGGLVGISGNPGLIDGGYTSSPTFAFYEKNGTWGIEGHGVDPDIQIIDDPAKMVDGGDPQLDGAIHQMLTELKEHPFTQPPRPAYPDRAGMGIRDEDK